MTKAMSEDTTSSAAAPADPSARPRSWTSQVRTPRAGLVAALLCVELVAGMQVYLGATIVPLAASEIGGRQMYGMVAAATHAAVFLTLPLAGPLMRRASPAALLTVLTPVTVLASVISAFAPSMPVFLAGRLLGGLAAGLLVGVSLGAIATALPPAWRRLVFAANNAMWVISSIVGPLYAAWLSAAFSWRVAMVAYLPFLVLARWVIIRSLVRIGPPSTKDAGERQPLPWGRAVLLAAGVAVMSSASVAGDLGWLALVVGLFIVLATSYFVLPTGLMTLAPGRPSSMAMLAVLAFVFFGADSVATIVAHDALGFDAAQIGLLLLLGGLTWSVVGLAVARWPARGRQWQIRGTLGMATIAGGLAGLGWATSHEASTAYFVGWVVINAGMGLVFVDALNLALSDHPGDTVSPTDAAANVAMSERLGSSLGMTLATTAVATNLAWGPWVFIALALCVPVCVLAILRSGPAHIESGSAP